MKSKAEQVAAFRRSEAHLSLLPPRVLGYSLKHGLWAQMAVDNVQRIVTSAESIDESFDQTLIMEETSKSLLKVGWFCFHYSCFPVYNRANRASLL
jgi:hypothetical protein